MATIGKPFLSAFLKALHLYDLARCLYQEGIALPNRASSRFNWRSGVTVSKRDPELIVSITSIPERIATIHICLDGLLRQSTKPDRILLWLNESNDPSRPIVSKDSLPKSLTRLQKRGLEIRWCRNMGVFTKIIPTLRAHPNALIVTADDDIIYPRYWLGQLYTAYRHEPQYIHCHRAQKITYGVDGKPMPYLHWSSISAGTEGPSRDIFPTGIGGVLYAPGHLHPEVLNEEAFHTLCAKQDDVWLKAMSLLNNVQCKMVATNCFPIRSIRVKNNRSLFDHNVVGGQNDFYVDAVNRTYSCFNASPRQ